MDSSLPYPTSRPTGLATTSNDSPGCGGVRSHSPVSDLHLHDENFSEVSTIQPTLTKHDVGWRHIIRNFSPS